MGLNVTLSPSKWVVVPDVRYGLTWEQLVDMLGVHRAYADKENDVPMFSPAEWLPGHTISKKGVAAIHFGVMDLDDTLEEDLVAIFAQLECAYVFLTSWSHGSTDPKKLMGKSLKLNAKATEERWGAMSTEERAPWQADAWKRTRGRIVFPFTRSVVPSEWPALWEALNTKLVRGLGDHTTKDDSRRYWFPSHPADPKKPPIRFVHSGPPVDVDALLGDRVARSTWVADDAPDGFGGGGLGGGLEVTKDQIRTIAKRLNGSTTPGRKAMGQAFYALLRGEDYASDGERHNTTFKLVCEVLDRHPLADARKLADLFAPSMQAMSFEDDVVGMIEKKQQGARATHAQRITEALGEGRSEPYTADDLDRIVDELGTTHAGLRHEWVVQKADSFYVQCDGNYRRYSGKDVIGGAARDLAPAISAGVDLFEITQKGQRLKTPLELVRDYGSVAEGGIIVDMMADRARYERDTRTFIEASCPIRSIEPVFHADIDRWLWYLGGSKAERLRQWIACLPRLDEPCSALYLEGAPGTGKTLLANGAARMWSTERPTELDEALAGFNEGLAKCPLVFADEAVPTDAAGKLRTSAIREFIQARQRPLKRKFLPHATLRGCVRVILAANNKGLLSSTEQLTEHDISALVERFFYLQVNPEAAAYLADVGPMRTKKWLEEDMITAHFRWLAENLEVPRTGRFLVSGIASDLANELATSTGHRAAVCQWLVGYALDPKKYRGRPGGRELVRVNAGRFLATAHAVHDGWDLYVTERAPTPAQISKALSGLSSEITLRTDKGNRKYRNVRLDLLVAWAASTSGYLDDEETLVRALSEIDETLIVAPQSN